MAAMDMLIIFSVIYVHDIASNIEQYRIKQRTIFNFFHLISGKSQELGHRLSVGVA